MNKIGVPVHYTIQNGGVYYEKTMFDFIFDYDYGDNAIQFGRGERC